MLPLYKSQDRPYHFLCSVMLCRTHCVIPLGSKQTGNSQWLGRIQDPAFFEAIVRLIKRFFSAKNAGIFAWIQWTKLIEKSALASTSYVYQMLEGSKVAVPTEESSREILRKYCQMPGSFTESFHSASWIRSIKFGYRNAHLVLWQGFQVSCRVFTQVNGLWIPSAIVCLYSCCILWLSSCM